MRRAVVDLIAALVAFVVPTTASVALFTLLAPAIQIALLAIVGELLILDTYLRQRAR